MLQQGGVAEKPRPVRPFVQMELETPLDKREIGTDAIAGRPGFGKSRKRRKGRSKGGNGPRIARRRRSRRGQCRLLDFLSVAALTETRPEPGSIVQRSSEPGPTPRIAATASGMVARTDEDPFTVRNTLDVNVAG